MCICLPEFRVATLHHPTACRRGFLPETHSRPGVVYLFCFLGRDAPPAGVCVFHFIQASAQVSLPLTGLPWPPYLKWHTQAHPSVPIPFLRAFSFRSTQPLPGICRVNSLSAPTFPCKRYELGTVHLVHSCAHNGVQ